MKKRLFRFGSGSLTSREIAFNLSQNDKDPERWQKGTRTRDFHSVRWVRPEDAQEVLDEARNSFPSFKDIRRKFNVEEVNYGPKGVSKLAYQRFETEARLWRKKWFGAGEGEAKQK